MDSPLLAGCFFYVILWIYLKKLRFVRCVRTTKKMSIVVFYVI